ncbi:MAG: D-tyrosyl-tRNA(Tyr) deacylase [Bacilli bacterium]|nr:D-tyrosyl-tRNA(Tyr) deacylase [Bacilli bacterium]
MKVLLQRSKNSKVTIDNEVNGEIKKGLVLLVGFTHDDNETIIDKMIDKIINLRIFEDEKGLMNLSLLDINGEILSISQFTLYADATSGRRPSFVNSMKKETASELYDLFNIKLKEKNIKVETGIFGADMKVEIYNDGPVTIMLDSKEIFK